MKNKILYNPTLKRIAKEGNRLCDFYAVTDITIKTDDFDTSCDVRDIIQEVLKFKERKFGKVELLVFEYSS